MESQSVLQERVRSNKCSAISLPTYFLSELVDKDTLLIQSRFSDQSKLSKGDNESWPVSVPSKEDFVVWRKFLASIVV